MGYIFPGTRVELGADRGWLDAPAAASIFRVDRAIGHPCQISEAGRTWDQQMRFWRIFQSGGNIALHPDTPSEHQKGKAVDSDELQRFIALMEDHGWRRTVYRWVNGVWTLVERWHFEYFEHLDNHINDPLPGSTPNPSEEGDMLIITATSSSADGVIKQGHTYVDTLTSPLTLLSAAEVSALRYWADHGIPLRDSTWPGQALREVMAVRGRRPFVGNAGKTDYNAPIEY